MSHSSPILYRFGTLYSGSTGNATLVQTPDGCFLVDAGRNAKTLLAALQQVGVSPEDLTALFVTHEHNDHIAALPVFLKNHPLPLHAVTATAQKFKSDRYASVLPHLVEHPPLYSLSIGKTVIRSFLTSHDSAASVGYRFSFPDENGQEISLSIATDTGVVTEAMTKEMTGCDAVILECNHDPELLRMGPYPYDLKLRILSRRGHLSNTDCAGFAAMLAAGGTRHILLAHLSEINNIPELAYQEVYAAVADESIDIRVAGENAPTIISVSSQNHTAPAKDARVENIAPQVVGTGKSAIIAAPSSARESTQTVLATKTTGVIC